MSPALFTRPAFTVPHDRVGVHWILLIHQAITRAFEIIRAEGFDLANAQENAITERLEDALENCIRNRDELEGFDSQFIASVTRGSETVNYNGVKISKKPDLIFRLRREHRIEWDQRQDAIFAECKPVDRAHPLTTNYCAVGTDRVGVERFVIGDYAWAMHEAIMIGYVRDGFRIHPHLAESLADPKRYESLGSPSIPVALPSTSDAGQEEPLHYTEHHRRFTWKENNLAATPIAIYHSWLCCS